VNHDIENLVGGYFKKKDRLKRTESIDVLLVNQSDSVDRSIPSFQNWRTEKRNKKLVESQIAKNEHIRTSSLKRLSNKVQGLSSEIQRVGS
jgi:hypothetical protein